jgi:hypothetical protein
MKPVEERVGITQTIREGVIREKQMREKVAQLDQYNLIKCGKRQEVVENLIFFTSPQHFSSVCSDLLREIEAG